MTVVLSVVVRGAVVWGGVTLVAAAKVGPESKGGKIIWSCTGFYTNMLNTLYALSAYLMPSIGFVFSTRR